MTNYQLNDIDQMVTEWLENIDNIIPKLIFDMHTETKLNRFDLVTNVDQQIQNEFQQFLSKHLPDHQLFAEEKSNEGIDPRQGHVWIMDPIDGTANLVKQQEDYCIILGYFVDGEPKLSYIYDYPHGHLYKAIENKGAYDNNQILLAPPIIDIKDVILSFNTQVLNDETMHELYEASFGHRIIGSCGLDSLRVIKGQFGAHINTNPKPWDIAAQFLFAKELGLKMSSLDGKQIDLSTAAPFIISNEGCYKEVLEILNSGSGYGK
ncbi:inositol monophosphatase family protein [Staphylococcus pasteuri]|uniref:inositol monophosphatase family protein n=1 Tax=Staphylococcus pasteuri TaxID=45972 RepID=UPI00118BA489|nr:inositol monophosphatase family protein [Staphylococcus pasteuri]QDW83907.1 inositol monophosphatase family protein [Staphylococcus pasteuri]